MTECAGVLARFPLAAGGENSENNRRSEQQHSTNTQVGHARASQQSQGVLHKAIKEAPLSERRSGDRPPLLRTARMHRVLESSRHHGG